MFRIATPAEVDTLLAAPATDLVGRVHPDRYREDLALHRYRPEWTWVAAEHGRIDALAIWWALDDAPHPVSLDAIWVAPDVEDPAARAGDLLSSALSRFQHAGLIVVPEVNIDLPSHWQDDPDTRAGLGWRRDACQRYGISDWNERYQLEWTTDDGLPTASGRLHYRPADDSEFLDVFRRVAVGSLDVLTRRALAELGEEGQARDDLEFYSSLPGDRALWRIALDRDDAVIGFAIPSRSAYDASVSYLGVAPEHRGHRYVDDLLAEITRLHVEAGAARITGTTDRTNAPMLEAFARAGYRTTGVRLVGTGPAPLSA